MGFHAHILASVEINPNQWDWLPIALALILHLLHAHYQLSYSIDRGQYASAVVLILAAQQVVQLIDKVEGITVLAGLVPSQDCLGFSCVDEEHLRKDW